MMRAARLPFAQRVNIKGGRRSVAGCLFWLFPRDGDSSMADTFISGFVLGVALIEYYIVRMEYKYEKDQTLNE